MSNKLIKITLYHAKWCGHCVDFLPLWNKMSSDSEALKNIEFKSYEESEINNLPEIDRSYDGVDVRSFGYPAIKISINDQDYMYEGKRTSEKIYTFILEKLKSLNGNGNGNGNGNANEMNGGSGMIKRRITLKDFKILFENNNTLKPFKYL